MLTEEGEYLTLVKPTSMGWNTVNIHTKEKKNLELVKDMAGMRYIGMLSSQTEEGVNVTNYDDQLVFVEERAYSKKLFLTAQVNCHKESVFVEYIPRSKYNNPACADAKQKELRKYKKYDVFEVVDIEDATDNIIATDWILTEKERQDGTKVIEARLGLIGDVEELLHKIRRKAPTVNNKSLKILLSIAVSQGWKIGTGNVERATSQLNQSQCEVFAKPPD